MISVIKFIELASEALDGDKSLLVKLKILGFNLVNTNYGTQIWNPYFSDIKVENLNKSRL